MSLTDLGRYTDLILDKFRGGADQGNLALYDLIDKYVAMMIAEHVILAIVDEMRTRPVFVSREQAVSFITEVVSRICSDIAHRNGYYWEYIFNRYPEEAKEMVERRIVQVAVDYCADIMSGINPVQALRAREQARTRTRTPRLTRVPYQPPTYAYTPMWHVPNHYNQNEDCEICGEMLGTNVFGHLSGNVLHVFHKECLDRWYISRGTCPKCRARFGSRKRSNRRY